MKHLRNFLLILIFISFGLTVDAHGPLRIGGVNQGAVAITGGTIAVDGVITGLLSTTVQTAEYTMTTAMQNGGAVLMTVAGDVNLLAAAVGNSFKVTVRDVTETVSIRPYTGDTLVFPGIAPVLDASDELDSPGAAGDEIICICYTVNEFRCNGTAGWTDGGAGD